MRAGGRGLIPRPLGDGDDRRGDGGGLARVTNKGFYYDVAERLTASVDVGTNNGTA